MNVVNPVSQALEVAQQGRVGKVCSLTTLAGQYGTGIAAAGVFIRACTEHGACRAVD
jgi:hypothetical protein